MDFSKLMLPAKLCCNKEVFWWCVTFQLESKGHDLSKGEWSPAGRLFLSLAVNLQFSFDEVLFMPLFDVACFLMFDMENGLLPYVCSLHSKPLFFFFPITASRLCCNRNNNYKILSLNLTLWLPPTFINWSYCKSLLKIFFLVRSCICNMSGIYRAVTGTHN